MRKSFHNVSIVICLALVLAVMTSCIIETNPSHMNYVPESMVGTWTTGYIYDSSDSIYDYSHTETMAITSDGYMSVTMSFFIKSRTGATWVKNYSKTPVTENYEVLVHEYSPTDGYLTVYARDTYATSARFDYRLSETGTILILTGNDGRSFSLAKIVDENSGKPEKSEKTEKLK